MMYVDDVAGVSASENRANDDLDVLLELLAKMGLPVSHAKVFRPARRGETLGGELDLDKGTVDLSETFLRKLGFRTSELFGTPKERRRIRALETLVHMHAHVGLFFPLLKPQVSESFQWYYKHRQLGTRGFDLDDDFTDLCNIFTSVSANAPSLPLLPALQFPARGHPLRIDVESDASGNIGWGIICLPPPGTDHFILYAHAHARWTPCASR